MDRLPEVPLASRNPIETQVAERARGRVELKVKDGGASVVDHDGILPPIVRFAPEGFETGHGFQDAEMDERDADELLPVPDGSHVLAIVLMQGFVVGRQLLAMHEVRQELLEMRDVTGSGLPDIPARGRGER